AVRDQVLLELAHLRGDDDLAFALDVAAEGNHPADFGDDGGFFGFAHLEELRHPGQAASDVLGFGGFPGDLDDYVPGKDLIAFMHHEDGAHRHEVAGKGRAPGNAGGGPGFVLHRDAGPELRVPALDDEAGGLAGHRVHPFLNGAVVHDVPELDAAAHFGEHGIGEGVPLRQPLAGLHRLPLLHLDVGPVGQGVAFPFDAFFADQDQFRLAAQVHQLALTVDYHLGIVETDPALPPGHVQALFGPPRGGAADVKGAHGELGAGLADGLGRQNTDGLADGHRSAVAQIPTVALGAHSPASLAGQHRADLHLLQAGLLDTPGGVFIDLFVGLHQYFPGVGINDVVQAHPP